jgi:hypothetical protein
MQAIGSLQQQQQAAAPLLYQTQQQQPPALSAFPPSCYTSNNSNNNNTAISTSTSITASNKNEFQQSLMHPTDALAQLRLRQQQQKSLNQGQVFRNGVLTPQVLMLQQQQQLQQQQSPSRLQPVQQGGNSILAKLQLQPQDPLQTQLPLQQQQQQLPPQRQPLLPLGQLSLSSAGDTLSLVRGAAPVPVVSPRAPLVVTNPFASPAPISTTVNKDNNKNMQPQPQQQQMRAAAGSVHAVQIPKLNITGGSNGDSVDLVQSIRATGAVVGVGTGSGGGSGTVVSVAGNSGIGAGGKVPLDFSVLVSQTERWNGNGHINGNDNSNGTGTGTGTGTAGNLNANNNGVRPSIPTAQSARPLKPTDDPFKPTPAAAAAGSATKTTAGLNNLVKGGTTVVANSLSSASAAGAGAGAGAYTT